MDEAQRQALHTQHYNEALAVLARGGVPDGTAHMMLTASLDQIANAYAGGRVAQTMQSAQGQREYEQRSADATAWDAKRPELVAQLRAEGYDTAQINDILEKREVLEVRGIGPDDYEAIKAKNLGETPYNPQAIIGSREGYEEQIKARKTEALKNNLLMSEIPDSAYVEKTFTKDFTAEAEPPAFLLDAKAYSQNKQMDLDALRREALLEDQQAVAGQFGGGDQWLALVQREWASGANYSTRVSAATGYEGGITAQLDKALKTGGYVPGLGVTFKLKEPGIKEFPAFQLPKGALNVQMKIINGELKVSYELPQEEIFGPFKQEIVEKPRVDSGNMLAGLIAANKATEYATLLTEQYPQKFTKQNLEISLPALGTLAKLEGRAIKSAADVQDFQEKFEKTSFPFPGVDTGFYPLKSIQETSSNIANFLIERKSGQSHEGARLGLDLVAGVASVPAMMIKMPELIGKTSASAIQLSNVLAVSKYSPSAAERQEVSAEITKRSYASQVQVVAWITDPSNLAQTFGAVIIPGLAMRGLTAKQPPKPDVIRSATFLLEEGRAASDVFVISKKAIATERGYAFSEIFPPEGAQLRSSAKGIFQEIAPQKQQLFLPEALPSQFSGVTFQPIKQMRFFKEPPMTGNLIVKTSVNWGKGKQFEIPKSFLDDMPPMDRTFKTYTTGEFAGKTPASFVDAIYEGFATAKANLKTFYTKSNAPAKIIQPTNKAPLGVYEAVTEIRKFHEPISIKSTGGVLEGIEYLATSKGTIKFFDKTGTREFKFEQLQYGAVEKLQRPGLFDFLAHDFQGFYQRGLALYKEPLSKEPQTALLKISKKTQTRKILPDQPGDIEVFKSFSEGNIGGRQTSSFAVIADVLSLSSQKFGTVKFSMGEVRPVSGGKLSGKSINLENALVDLRNVKKNWADLAEPFKEPYFSQTKLESVKFPAASDVKQLREAPLFLAEAKDILPAKVASLDFSKEISAIFETPGVKPKSVLVGGSSLQFQKTVFKEAPAFKEGTIDVQAGTQKQIQLTKPITKSKTTQQTKSIQQKPPAARQYFMPSTKNNIQAMFAPLTMKHHKIKPLVFLTGKTIQSQKPQGSERTVTKQRQATGLTELFKQRQQQNIYELQKMGVDFKQPGVTLFKYPQSIPPQNPYEVLFPPTPPRLPPLWFPNFEESGKKLNLKKQDTRKFKYTSDIVSQSFGITAKTMDRFAALTGTGLRPVVKRGAKRGRS